MADTLLAGGAISGGGSAADNWQNMYNSLNGGARPGQPGYVAPAAYISGVSGPNFDLNPGLTAMGGAPYVQAALDKQKIEEGNASDKAASQGAGAIANARDSLAAHGGLHTGASDMLALQGQRGQMQALQDVNQQGALNRANIGLQGANMDQAANKENIAEKTGFIQGQNTYNQNAAQNLNAYNANTYNQQMQSWAGANQAQAMLAGNRRKGQQGGVMGGVGQITGK